MFDQLEKYQNKGHFFFMKGNSLEEVAKDIPDEPGVYCVYALVRGHIELVYIGKSGMLEQNGTFNGSMLNQCINYKKGGIKRDSFFKRMITKLGADALDIYWYVTFDKKHPDLPAFVEAILLQKFYDIYGRLPLWNKSF